MWTHIRSRSRPVRGHTRRFFSRTFVDDIFCLLGRMSLHRQKRLDERMSIAPSLAARVDRKCASQSQVKFQARTCNTLVFRAVARSATHRYRVSRPAPYPRARMGARAATLSWRGGHGAGKEVPPPPPRRRRPAGVVQRLRAGPLPHRAAHLRAADKVHGRADGMDRRTTGTAVASVH